MKVAFIAPFGMQPKATVSARMLPLAQALARRGHNVRIVVPPWDDPSAPDKTQRRVLAAPTGPGSVEIVTLSLPRHAPGGIALTYGLLREALLPPRGELSRFRAPDVVHVFKPIGYSALAAFMIQAMGIPWVLDMDDWEGAGGWTRINPYSPTQKALITLTEAILPRMARAATVASRTLQARTWDFGISPGLVLYMPNGVSEEKYRSWDVEAWRRHASTADNPTILLYTRFAEFPLHWPLRVLRLVLREHPQARLLVVGEGFFGEGEKLQRDAARIGIADRLTVTGRVAENEVPRYLAMGDVALYPMEDNLITRAKSPVKVLEPMLMGLPMVAHRVGQAAEFIGDAGVLVEPGNLTAMAEAVSQLLSDPERRKYLGERARQRVWTRFNWDVLCREAERAYRMAGVTRAEVR